MVHRLGPSPLSYGKQFQYACVGAGLIKDSWRQLYGGCPPKTIPNLVICLFFILFKTSNFVSVSYFSPLFFYLFIYLNKNKNYILCLCTALTLTVDTSPHFKFYLFIYYLFLFVYMNRIWVRDIIKYNQVDKQSMRKGKFII